MVHYNAATVFTLCAILFSPEFRENNSLLAGSGEPSPMKSRGRFRFLASNELNLVLAAVCKLTIVIEKVTHSVRNMVL